MSADRRRPPGVSSLSVLVLRRLRADRGADKPTRLRACSPAKRQARRPGVSTLSPSRLAPEFSLTDPERPLSTLAGDALIDVRGVPEHFHVALRAAISFAEQHAADSSRVEIGLGAALAALCVHGLHRLERASELEAWRRLRAGVSERRLDARAQLRVHASLHDGRFEIANRFDRARKRLQFRCNEQIRLQLFGAADRVFGCAGSALVLASAAYSLTVAPGVDPEFVAAFEADIAGFLASYERRAQELEIALRIAEEQAK